MTYDDEDFTFYDEYKAVNEDAIIEAARILKEADSPVIFGMGNSTSQAQKNAIESSTGRWPQLSVEDLIRLNPDIIVDLRPDFHEDIEELKRMWHKTAPASTVKAIAEDHIAVITHHHALLPSLKVIEVHKILQKIIGDYQNTQ